MNRLVLNVLSENMPVSNLSTHVQDGRQNIAQPHDPLERPPTDFHQSQDTHQSVPAVSDCSLSVH